MRVTRRQFVAAAAVGPLAQASQDRVQTAAPVRGLPTICLYSQALVKIDYADLGPIYKGLGAEGCDLSVQRGGHVAPSMASLDLTRAVESLRGAGIDVPVITTALTSAQDPDAGQVLGIAGIIKVPLFRPGHWKYGAADPMTRLGEVRREISMLAAMGRSAGMALALHNGGGDTVGAAIWDTDAMIRTMDPQAVGYDFDAGAASAAGGDALPVALRLAMPRLKMLTAADAQWTKADGAWKLTPCPLGEGMVDWTKLFAALARANFVGPISLHVDYPPAGDAAAIQHDLEFLKKQRGAAYQG